MRKSTETVVTVSLLTNPDRARRDFPEQMDDFSPHEVVEADYHVRINFLRDTFATWLAINIPTTSFRDDASVLQLLMPFTEGQRWVRDVMETTEHLAHCRLADALDHLEGSAKHRRKLYERYEARFHDHLLIDQFDWPIYGSAASETADTPEAYFEACAKRIRRMGAVPLGAGPSCVRPDDSLLRTFANGRGLALVERHERERDELRVA